MGAFELSNRESAREEARDKDDNQVLGIESTRPDPRRIKEECLIALKVYDSCRHPRRKILQRG